MREWVPKFLCLIVSVIAGFAVGYAATSLRVVAMSPMGLNLARTTDPFTRVFIEMTRLGEAERVLGCKSTANPSSRQAALRGESELIGGLRTDAQVSGLTPALDVAEAISKLRSNGVLPNSMAGDSGAATVNELIRRSGWGEDSEPALREALAKRDGACKQ